MFLRATLALSLTALFIIVSFSDGADSTVSKDLEVGGVPTGRVVVSFPRGGGMDPSLAISVPDSGPVSHSSLKIGPEPGPAYPSSVKVDIGLDGRYEWEFGGGNQGSFGRQDTFIDGAVSLRAESDRETIASFLIPRGMDVSDVHMGLISMPLPYARNLGREPEMIAEELEPEKMDTADVDGDGREEFFFYSNRNGEIRMVEVASENNISVSTIFEDVGPVAQLRAVRASGGDTGYVVFSSEEEPSSTSVTLLIPDEGGFNSVVATSGLPGGAGGFSVYTENDGSSRLFCSNGGEGAVVEVSVRGGSSGVSLTELIDRTFDHSGLGTADLDGDGQVEVLLFPMDKLDGNLSELDLDGTVDPPAYVIRDLGSTVFMEGGSVSADSNGDGCEELYARTGTAGSPTILHMSADGELDISYPGLNGTVASPRRLMGYGGIYGGPEDMVYLITPEGPKLLLPKSRTGGAYVVKSMEGFDGVGIIGSLHGVDVPLSVDSGGGWIWRERMIWDSPDGLNIRNPYSERSIATSLQSGTFTKVDLESLELEGGKPPLVTQEYGVVFTRIDLEIDGDPGLFSIHSLSLEYGGLIEVSTGSDFMNSVDRAIRIFEGDAIPFSIIAGSEGTVEVGPALVIYDSPPAISPDLPTPLCIPEGSPDMPLLYLSDHLTDDILSPFDLEVELMQSPELPDGLIYMQGGVVRSRANGFPDLNGDFSFHVEVSDGTTTVVSNMVELIIEPVQDPPRLMGDPPSLTIEEGKTARLSLSPDIFTDPEGDEIHYSAEVVSSDPYSLSESIRTSIEGDELLINPLLTGPGGTAVVEICGWDEHNGKERCARGRLALKVVDGDAGPEIRMTPDTVELMEDQRDPFYLSLDDWFWDKDTPLSAYSVKAEVADKSLLEADVILFDGRPYLRLMPVEEASGPTRVRVVLSSYDWYLSDILDVEIAPKNDVPVIEITGMEGKDEEWVIAGRALDPDSHRGTVRYRIAGGEWYETFGFGTWSFRIPYEDLPPTGGFIFIEVEDDSGGTAIVHMELDVPDEWASGRRDSDGDGVSDALDRFPFNPYEWMDTDGDGFGDAMDAFPNDPLEHLDSDGDGVGDEADPRPLDPNIRNREDLNSQSVVPDPERDGNGGINPLIAFGLGAGAVGIMIFLALTEVGLVTMATIGATLYSKLSRKDILNHEVRGLIRGYIIANPGDHYSSIKRNLDLNNGTLAYHLRVLEQNNLIKSFYDGVYKRYYPANVNIQKVQRNVSKQEEILNIIIETPGVSMDEIGKRIGVSRQVVNYHVKNLIRAGLVSYSRDRKSSRFYPADESAEGVQKRKLRGEA